MSDIWEEFLCLPATILFEDGNQVLSGEVMLTKMMLYSGPRS